MGIIVSKLPTPIHNGDWHDAPVKWSVTGPGAEIQNFSTRKDAEKYRVLRRRAASFAEASAAFVKWA